MQKIKVIELFSGIGAQRAALDRVAKKINAEIEHVAICEIDPYAIKSYEAIFGKTMNLGDISKVQSLPYCDLLTWSFPCTDLSKAGKCQGMEEGSGTRSALAWEVLRVLKASAHRPEWLVMENVTAVHNKHNSKAFNEIIDILKGLGYTSKWADMNSKDHGVAQNRDRCIMVSHLGGDVPDFGSPRATPLDKVLRDYLEENVDEKYYLTEEQLQRMVLKNDINKVKGRGFDFVPRTGDAIACSITTRSGQRETDNYVMCEQVGTLNREGWHECVDRVYGTNGLCPTINTCGGGGHDVKILENCALKVINGDTKGWMEAKDGDGVWLGYLTGKETARGRVQDQVAPTLQTTSNAGVIIYDGKYWRIRALTPRECWRLFGRTDEEYDRAKNAVVKVCKNGSVKRMSETQLKKQAGNSIVVEVLEDVFETILRGE